MIKMVIRILSVLFCRMDLWKLKSLSHIPCFKAAYYRQLNKLGSYIGDSAYFSDIPSFPHGIKSIFISGGQKSEGIVLSISRLPLEII